MLVVLHDVAGRVKDLIVLSTGKIVAAGNVEATIAQDLLFDQFCVVENARARPIAVVVLEPEVWLQN